MNGRILTVALSVAAAVARASALEIVLPPSCGEKAHRIAAGELSRYWEEICARRLEIVGEATAGRKSIRFTRIGQPAGGYDAYTIRSVDSGLELGSVNGRSALYAVYDFLERRGGCRWFWDGDVVPKGPAPDITGLDVKESSTFEYRGLRYFAHRGLTRFQAEHWGLEDWKKEIDWCLKRRLNLMMPRIGTDDVFQKAFPGIVDYPDPAKPLPEAMEGFDNRSLFWSLQFRGLLRKSVLSYAFDRGMMVPEDFGTMSHWYSRTPWQFLDKVKPDFLPQEGGCYGHPTDRVWDVRDERWLDEYWKLTRASLDYYGKPDLLHTIGLGERLCYKDRSKNFALKKDVIKRLVAKARSECPGSRVLLAGWDFYFSWYPEEVAEFVKELDPAHTILWDYAADANANEHLKGKIKGVNNFTRWDVVGKFPYTFGIFLALEQALDIRANYPLIVKRQKAIAKDPFCKGYIFWPESAHTDIMLLRYFTANAWKGDKTDVDALVSEFCRDRYGRHASGFEEVWKKVIPLSGSIGWRGNCVSHVMDGWKNRNAPDHRRGAIPKELLASPSVFRSLAEIPWEGDFVRRDGVDLARTAADRFISAARSRLMRAYHRWKAEESGVSEVKAAADAYTSLWRSFADLLALHTDYSLYESYLRLDGVEKIRNPDFEHVLYDNAANYYCVSHQYEIVRHQVVPAMEEFASLMADRAAKGDRSDLPEPDLKRFLVRSFHRPLVEMRPTLPRTGENWRRVLKDLAAAAEEIVKIK